METNIDDRPMRIIYNDIGHMLSSIQSMKIATENFQGTLQSLESENKKLMHVIAAIVTQSGGEIRIPHEMLLKDYTWAVMDDPITNDRVIIKAEYATAKKP